MGKTSPRTPRSAHHGPRTPQRRGRGLRRGRPRITEGGLWHEWFPGLPLVNRGIGGNAVDDVLARVDTAVADPAAVFLLVGTNDLDVSGVMENLFSRNRTIDEIAGLMRQLVAAIRERAPYAQLFVQSVMPRQAELADLIQAVNSHYQRIAHDAGAAYIDLWPALADASGGLRPGYTLDDLHLTGAGYDAWVKALRPTSPPSPPLSRT